MRSYLLVGAAIAAVVAPAAASAQQLTTTIEGTVTDTNSAPVPGAQVLVTDTRTGNVRTLTANAQGRFAADNLQAGGPYTVEATADGFEGQTINGVNTTLQGNTSLKFMLTTGGGTIVVTAQRVNLTQLAVGPGTAFGQGVIDSTPSYGRDIQDVISIDPRVALNSTGDVATYSCLGGNNRTNSFTVDGIQQGDVFGLNGTGYASRTSAPLPYDSMREIQVQFAPYDVEYDQFTGCQVNVLTKSGSNTFHGSAFFEYSDNGLRGTKVAGKSVSPISPEKRWGASLGGPIIKDKLFFFGAYSHIETASGQDYGPAGAGYANTLSGVTQADYDAVAAIAKNVYGQDPGALVTNLPYTNDRYFARLDWQINDKHRLEATYQRLKEVSMNPDDLSTRSGSVNLVGMNTYQFNGTDSNYYSGRLYSNWTDNFSTELRYSYSKVNDIQDPVGGGEAQSANPLVRLIVAVSPTATVQIGPGYSRVANQLNTKIQQGSAIAKLNVGNHKLKWGFQFNQTDIYNLFVQNATGTLTFASISDFQNGILNNGSSTSTSPSNVSGGSAVGGYGRFSYTGNINDAAAIFSRTEFSGFAQDDWQITPSLNMVAGVRLNWYDGSAPKYNPTFFARYGISNAVPFSTLPVQVLPRVAFTFDAPDFGPLSNNKLRAGVGLYSGGDPVVWFSNAFSNNGYGYAQATTTTAGCGAGPLTVVSGGSFTGFPTCVVNAAAASASGGNGTVNPVDPNIKMPSVLRANIGLESNLDFAPSGFFSGWKLKLDYIYSHYINPFAVADLSQVVNPSKGLNGYTIDGRPIYSSMDPSAAGCNAVLEGVFPTPIYSGVSPACFATSRYGEVMLTNSKGFDSHVASIILQKHFNRGIFTDGGSVNFSLGYAFTRSGERRAFTSSVASSNFKYPATFNIQDPSAQRSLFSQTNSIALNMTFGETFFSDLKTKLSVKVNATSGAPYALTWQSSDLFAKTGYGYNALAYIPTGTSDPNVSPSSDMTAVANLANFADTHKCARKYKGMSIAGNTCFNPWYFDMDLVLSQELPGPGHLFGVKDKIKVYAMVDNFLNMLDNNWNTLKKTTNYGSIAIGDISGVDSQGRYIITKAYPSNYDDRNVYTNASLWRVKVGVSYSF